MKLKLFKIISVCILTSVLGFCSDSETIQNINQKEIPNSEENNAPPTEPPINNNQGSQGFVFDIGKQEIFFLKETKSGYGFYFYAPSTYNTSDKKGFPLLIHLHGGGARGEGTSEPSMNRIIYDGPPSLIKNNTWNPPTPMIVASPQSPHLWDPKRLHSFIDYLITNLNIDTSRIYMTGFSMGGRGIFDYVTEYGDQAHTAAVVPIAGWSEINNGKPFKNIALWAFHGDSDNIVNISGSKNMVNAINKNAPKLKAKLTVLPRVNHFSWPKVYDSSGIGSADPAYDDFDITIYKWMLKHSK